MSEATPRVTASYLEQFMNRTVRLVGKVIELRGEQATIDAGGQITVLLNRDSHLQKGHAFEIVGKVMQDLKVKMLAGCDFGTSIDFKAVDALVEATHRYPGLFFDRN